MARVILSDENCEGQARAIFRALGHLGYIELLALELKTLPELGLYKGIDDETIWRHCQEHQCLLLTGNRTATDGMKSLEYVVQHLVTATSVPVLTISNPKRIRRDRAYVERCANSLAEVVLDLEERYLGVTRLYLPFT